jgi:hypothetical protein
MTDPAMQAWYVVKVMRIGTRELAIVVLEKLTAVDRKRTRVARAEAPEL